MAQKSTTTKSPQFNSSFQFKCICIALFTIQTVAKQLYRKLSFYNIFSCSLSAVTMSSWCTIGRNVWQKSVNDVIKQRVNTINSNHYMLQSSSQLNLVVLCVVSGLASSEVLWGVGIISFQVFGHLRSFKGWILTEACVTQHIGLISLCCANFIVLWLVSIVLCCVVLICCVEACLHCTVLI